MIMAEVFTLVLYIGSMIVLPEYFGKLPGNIGELGSRLMELCIDLSFIFSQRFVIKVAIIVAISSFPLWAIKAFRSRFAPATYVKVAQY